MSPDIISGKNLSHWLFDSERTFRSLIEHVHAGVYIADEKGKLAYVNEAFVEILGYGNKEELLGKDLSLDVYVDPRERQLFLKAMEKNGFVRNYQVRNRRKDGSVIVLSATSHYIYNDSHGVVGVEGIVIDITDKIKLEDSLLNEKSKLEQILEFDERLATIHRVDKLLDYVIGAIARIMNVQRCSIMLLDEATGELCIKASLGLSDDVVIQSRMKLGDQIAGIVAKEGIPVLVKNIEYDDRFRRKSRASCLGRSFIVFPMKVDQRVIGVVNLTDKAPDGRDVFTDLDLRILSVLIRQAAVAIENVRLYRELEYLANNDPLTNLNNYRGLVQRLDQEINRYRRFNGHLSILMMDIDNFKIFNDRYGHLEGDRLLQEVGKALKGNLRSIDSVCRYGGDEFMVILPGVDGAQAQKVAQKISRCLEAISAPEPVRVSIGAVEYRAPWDRLDFVSKVDKALYEVKRQHKNISRAS